MATGDLNQFDDRLNRIEGKIDGYYESLHRAILGNPETGSPGIDGRLRVVERDMSLAKKALAVSMGGIITVGWDALKRKIGMS
jgi:hypothetical protein